jgi:hypothetical protein
MPRHGKLIMEGTNSPEDEFEWDDLVLNLTSIMKQKNPDGYWNARVENFGWRKLEGRTDTFKAMTGEQLLFKILPATECSFRIYHHGKNGFAINNVHHDSPMWGVEWYFIDKANPTKEE